MSSETLPTARKMRMRLGLLDAGLALVVLSLMVGYLALLLDLSVAEWKTFGLVLGAFGVLAAVVIEPVRRRYQRPIIALLEEDASGTTSQQTREAFRAVIALPSQMQLYISATWLAATLWVPVCMHLSGHAGWGLSLKTLAVLAAGLSGAGVSASVSFFLAKRELALVRDLMAARIADPEERRALIRSVPLARKVQLAMAGSVLTSLVFSMFLSYVRAGTAVDENAAEWQQRVLASVVSQLGDDPSAASLDRALRGVLPRADLMPFSAEFELVPVASIADDERFASLWAPIAEGTLTGSNVGGVLPSLQSFSGVDGGWMVVSTIPRAALRASFPALRNALFLALIIGTLVAVCVGQLLASDLRRATTLLGSAAEDMAKGDLRRGRILESEDELGDLARSFERMGSALRATVGRVAEAADRVDAAASLIASVSDEVVTASGDQAGRIEEAKSLMVRITGQVAEVSDSARALNVSVEESSSSILELGAAGDELNETASVLSGKVDEVSSSIEQMVRSVKQVRAVGDGLGDAAQETSSSMEEMASAMRAVDNTAAMTAELSREVVDSAESGQLKVSQTIEGMQAIRDATDSAEGVIRGLGARTEEIGAILDVIDDVADETNLLALNAAIIAAQAGEHGRAFSVVAEEIKELADRVLASTKEIGGLIRSVQDESSNAIGAIEQGSASVAQGVELSADAGISLEGITRSSRESGERIGEIVLAVQEQTKAAGHVVELMDRVRTGVDQIATAGAEQDRGNETVYRSAVTMSEVAQQVRRTTEEQSRGFGRIRESVEGVRDAVEQINGSLQEQSSACTQVAEALEEVVDRTRGNEQAAQGLGDAVQSLVQQAETLREDVARFQI